MYLNNQSTPCWQMEALDYPVTTVIGQLVIRTGPLSVGDWKH